MAHTTVKRTITGQLPYGADLYDELTRFIRREKIRFGRLQALGATTHAVVAYYDQQKKEYQPIEFPDGMEILNLYGNISIREGEPFLHLHVLLGDRNGRVFGGHLLPGTRIWALEVIIDEFDGEPPVRMKDETTGLFLWSGEQLT